MKFFKIFARRKPEAEPQPEQELFPAAEQKESAEAEAELIAIFDDLYLFSLARRRKAVIDAFTEAVNYSPHPGPARDKLSNAFNQALIDLSGPQLFFEGFKTPNEQSAFGSDVGKKLEAVAKNSNITYLRQRALDGLAATTAFRSVSTFRDMLVLTDRARFDSEPAVRATAIKNVTSMVTQRQLPATPNYPTYPFDIRNADNFVRRELNEPVTAEEYVMGFAAHMLVMDPHPSVRQEAARALRDIAAIDPPKLQYLAASFAWGAQRCQDDRGVHAVINEIMDSSRVVNFKRHQIIPGFTAPSVI
jgi:hypothetical protein